ncbi:MAG: hypothetical protein ABEH59_08005 [Halobacteriales archaeon]
MAAPELDNLRTVGLWLAGIVISLLGALVLFYPGPVALGDRVPFGLLFVIPGLIVLNRARHATQA